MKENITGIILCGGRNKRMNGQNKAFLEIEGKTFLDLISSKFKELGIESIIISNEPELFQKSGIKVYKDIIKKSTPLSGIHSGLSNIETDFGFVAACDMPFLKKELIAEIISQTENQYDTVTPNEGSFFQPLCSVYSKKCIPFIEALLLKDEVKVDRLFELVRVKKVSYEKLRLADPLLESFFNVNCFEDYQGLMRKKIAEKL